jgi:hypothetical protein
MRVHYTEVFFAEGTKKGVHCSELGGVHYIEVHLQQKSIGGTETRVQIGGVHYIEVFIKGGFTVDCFNVFFLILLITEIGYYTHTLLVTLI